MHAIKILHKIFEDKLPFVHKARLNCLMLVSKVLLKHNKLSLSALGRNIKNKVSVRDNIKRVCRLIGNKHLYNQARYFYKELTLLVVKNNLNPWIIIDWSCLSSVTNLYLLRASITLKGRSFVLYEEVHDKKFENNHSVHANFLNTLKEILPNGTMPVIVTDAGFRAPWFSYVLSLGWHFVGRLRHKNLIQLKDQNEWFLSSLFYADASENPKYIGEGFLTKDNKVPCHLVSYKEIKKNRYKINKNKTKSTGRKSVKYGKSSKEPWLIVTSLNDTKNNPFKAIKTYKTRMQIEENIRDTKSQFGFRLNESQTKKPQRMALLLLIAAIATFICWLGGILAKKMDLARKFQSSSSKFSSKLSIVFLGKEALKKEIKMTKRYFYSSLKILRALALYHHLDML